jgi:hypothetical protein
MDRPASIFRTASSRTSLTVTAGRAGVFNLQVEPALPEPSFWLTHSDTRADAPRGDDP